MLFRDSAAHLTVLEPRHRAEGRFGGKYLRIGGEEVVDLSGLDYLALGSAPEVKRVLADSLGRHDCAIPGSEAVIQTAQSHDLEQELADFHLGGGAAITFSTGYAANFSLMEAFGLRGRSHFLRMHRAELPSWPTSTAPTLFFLDGDLHFSARHGIRFSTRLQPDACSAITYRTGDMSHLESLLRASFDVHGEQAVRIILTDTVESATGREFDMASLCRLAEAYDCLLYADEAHAVGALGPQGRGITAGVPDFERYRDRLIIMGTLTKVFCQPGGYAVMSDPALAAMLKFCSPQHVFSAPVAPWIAAATTRLVNMVAGEFGDRRRSMLRSVNRHVRELLAAADFEVLGPADTPIVAIPLRVASAGTQVVEFLQQAGFICSVFQGPLMPIGREVLRLSMRADLTADDLDRLTGALVKCRDALHFT